MRALFWGMFCLVFLSGVGPHESGPSNVVRNFDPTKPSTDGRFVLKSESDKQYERAVMLQPRLEILDGALEAARPKPRPISRAQAKAESIDSNYVSEFLVQYLANLESCFSEVPKGVIAEGIFANNSIKKAVAWPLDKTRSADQLTAAEIEAALEDPKYQIRMAATHFLEAHQKELFEKMESLFNQKIGLETRTRLEIVLKPQRAKRHLKVCMAKAEGKYVASLVGEIYPAKVDEKCAADEGRAK